MGKDEKQTEADRTRGPREIRGSKRFWRVISTINPGNSVAYWLIGRKKGPRPA